MSLKLMYITNKPEIAKVVESAGVDRIFVDMEYIGKSDRQGGMDTVQSRHTVDDIKKIKKVINNSKLMVRINPIHDASSLYTSTKEEIEEVINSGADIIMLPYFKTADEVRKFICYVDGRAKTLPLVETVEAVENIDEILEIDGIDEIYVGLNDLSLGYKKSFMFELLADGTVEMLCEKFKKKGIPYGFGGIASIGHGMLSSEYVIREHYRLGSTCSILSRSFCNVDKTNLEDILVTFNEGVRDIRLLEQECQNHINEMDDIYFNENKEMVKRLVDEVLS